MSFWQRKEKIGDATQRTIIYALCEPLPNWQTGRVRYVGKTSRMPSDRLKHTVRVALRAPRLPVHWWLRKNIAANLPHHIVWLEVVPPDLDWSARERHWIAHYRALEGDLLNLTDGGEGLAGHSFTDEHRSKISRSLKTGSNFLCEVCGAQFWRKKNQIAKGHNRFCSRVCSNRRGA